MSLCGMRPIVFMVVFAISGLDAAAQQTPAPSPSAAASKAPEPARSPGPGTPALVVDEAGAQTLLGIPVQTAKGEDLGRVVDVIVDRSGGMLAAIVDFGGFLGVGSRKIAVDWRILHFPKSDGMGKLITDVPISELRNAPAFKTGEPIVIMGAPAAAPAAVVASPKPSPSPSSP